jgi:uncharacterized membrane protein YhaH (DUF805 family)
MLGFLFGFNARLGRLHYFLATIVLAVVMVILCFALARSIIHSTSRGSLSFAQMTWPMIALIALFVLASCSLQCMRIRDIGWDPVCVMPVWFTIMIIDWLVATKIPAWSLDAGHNGTVVGGLVNLGMTLVLLFWPGGGNVYTPPSFDAPRQPDPPPSRGGESVATSRIARVANGGFGRRSA